MYMPLHHVHPFFVFFYGERTLLLEYPSQILLIKYLLLGKNRELAITSFLVLTL